MAHIPIFDVAAACQKACVADESVDSYVSFPEDWIVSQLGSFPQNLVGLKVEGNSMEPKLQNGDVVLVDRVHHETRLLTEGVSLFRYHENFLIKHLRPQTGCGVEIISSNHNYKQSKIHSTEEEQGEAVIMGTVVWPRFQEA